MEVGRIDEKKLLPILKEQEAQVAEFVKDTDKLEKFLERLEQKLNLIPVVGDKLGDIPILISLVRAYSKREYADIPLGAALYRFSCQPVYRCYPRDRLCG